MSSRLTSADRRFAKETGSEREIADLAEPVLDGAWLAAGAGQGFGP